MKNWTPSLQNAQSYNLALAERERRRRKTQTGPYDAFKARYWSDPVGFVRDCIQWKPGDGPTAYQCDVLGRLVTTKRVSVRGPHGLGKTGMAAWVVLTQKAWAARARMMKLPKPRRWKAGSVMILSNTAVSPTTKTRPLAARVSPERTSA